MMAVEFTSHSAKVKREMQRVMQKWVRDTTFQLQRESLTRTPVDTTQLRSSQSFVFGADEQGDFGAVGYTAEHAPEVHEIPDAELSPQTRARRDAAGTSSNFLRGPYEELREQWQHELEQLLRGMNGSNRDDSRNAAD